MDEDRRNVAGLVALGIYGACLVGLLGLFVAYVAFGDRDWLGAAAALGASALGFGLTANALLRR